MTQLALRITTSEPTTGWLGHWAIDGEPVGPPIAVAGPAVAAIATLGRSFLELFERTGQGRPFRDPEALRGLGRSLHGTWFEPAWPEVRERLASRRAGQVRLVIQSDDRDILNLPWELVEIDGEQPSGRIPTRRCPGVDRAGAGDAGIVLNPEEPEAHSAAC